MATAAARQTPGRRRSRPRGARGAPWTGFGKGWLGRLPGDLHVQRDGMSFHFPIVTCLLVSLALSILLWLFRK